MKVVKIFADSEIEWNCSQWRDLTPADNINRVAATNEKYKNWSAKLIHVSGALDYLNPAIQDIIGPADIITVQRNLLTEELFDAIRYWQGMGKPFTADLDDAYPILPWSNPAHEFWINDPHDVKPLEKLEDGIRLCGHLCSPNRFILQDWSHVARGYHLPNFAERAWWTNLKDRQTMKKELGLENRIVIGWGGSVSHYDSWWGSGIREATTKITDHYPEVVWMICGNDPRLYEQLPVHQDNKILQPGVEPAKWPQIIKTFDIGIAPLFGLYDQRRSWIKTLEYGLASVPWIASAGEPYSDHKQLGKLVNGVAREWEHAIETTIKNLKREQIVAEQRVKYYQQWFADNQLPAFERVYTAIINNHREMIGRLPGLHFVNWK